MKKGNHKYLFAVIVWMISVILPKGFHAQLILNEVCVDNEELLADQDGEYSDWIEIYNSSEQVVSLQGWALSDKGDNPMKWIFPAVDLHAHEFMIVFASGKNILWGEELHTSFKIDEGNEGCYLTGPIGITTSAISPHTLPADLSYGVIPDGAGTCFYMATPTPGYSNNHATPEFFDQNTLLSFSHDGGFHDSPFGLEISSNDLAVEIRYTTDGSPVTPESNSYSNPIPVEAPVMTFTGNAYIPTSDTWQEPDNGVRNVTTVRAIPFVAGFQVGPEVVHTYFVGNQIHSLYPHDIVSLTIRPGDFFSDATGIYVHGESEYGNFSGHGMEWERRAFLEYYSADRNTIARQTVGTRIHGRSSRFSPQKNIRLYGRPRYGKNLIDIPGLANISQQGYKELILRAPESLFSTTLFTDEYVQSVIRFMNIDVQAQRPAVLFINGEYWGVHHIRERQSEHYLVQHHGVDPENVDILDWDRELFTLNGDAENYHALEQFLHDNDLSVQSNYEFVSSWVDIPSFMDYMTAQLFFANEDFTENNVRLWREREDGAKWRFFFFDADATMREHWQDRLSQFLTEDIKNDPVSLLFGSLLKNEDFRQVFAAVFLSHLSTTFSPDNLLSLIEEFSNVHEPLVAEHIGRWHRPESFAEWHNALNGLRNFAITRPPIMLQHLNEHFPHPFDIYPNPASNVCNVRFFTDPSLNTPVFELSDITGALVEAPTTIQGNIISIDTRNLHSGIYILRVDMGKMNYTDKIIVTSR